MIGLDDVKKFLESGDVAEVEFEGLNSQGITDLLKASNANDKVIKHVMTELDKVENGKHGQAFVIICMLVAMREVGNIYKAAREDAKADPVKIAMANMSLNVLKMILDSWISLLGMTRDELKAWYEKFEADVKPDKMKEEKKNINRDDLH